MAGNLTPHDYRTEASLKDKLQNVMQNQQRSKGGKSKSRTKMKTSKTIQPAQTLSSDDSIIFDIPTTSFYELSSPESDNDQYNDQYYVRRGTNQQKHDYKKMQPSQRNTRDDSLKQQSCNMSCPQDSRNMSPYHHQYPDNNRVSNGNRLTIPVDSHHPQPTPRQKCVGTLNRPLSIPSVSSVTSDDHNAVR